MKDEMCKTALLILFFFLLYRLFLLYDRRCNHKCWHRVRTEIQAVCREECSRDITETGFAENVAIIARASERRVLGRPLQTQQEMEGEITEKWGGTPSEMEPVLESVCKERKLLSKEIAYAAAERVASRGRPLLLSFEMPHEQWKRLSLFFYFNPRKVMSKETLTPIQTSWWSTHCGTYTMVIEGATTDHWKVKNSWWCTSNDQQSCRITKDALLTFEFLREIILRKMKIFDVSLGQKDYARIKSLTENAKKC